MSAASSNLASSEDTPGDVHDSTDSVLVLPLEKKRKFPLGTDNLGAADSQDLLAASSSACGNTSLSSFPSATSSTKLIAQQDAVEDAEEEEMEMGDDRNILNTLLSLKSDAMPCSLLPVSSAQHPHEPGLEEEEEEEEEEEVEEEEGKEWTWGAWSAEEDAKLQEALHKVIANPPT